MEGAGGRGRLERRERGREVGGKKKNQLERLTSDGGIGQLQLEVGASLPRRGAAALGGRRAEKTHLKRHEGGGGQAPTSPQPLPPWPSHEGGHDEKMPAGEAHSRSGIVPECF